MFNEEKVAQMAGYLLQKRGGRMNLLKLMKLLYLCDRESVNLYDESMSNDLWFSLDHGPILSRTYNLMNGSSDKPNEGWNKWISDRENHDLSLNFEPSEADFSELSIADLKIMDAIYDKFGHYNRWQLEKYTHDFCPEWTDPKGSSIPINPLSLFEKLGRSPKQLEDLSEWIKELDDMDKIACHMR